MSTEKTPNAADRGSELTEVLGPGSEASKCPACHGSGVIQTSDSAGLVDQFACDLCSNSEDD